MGQITPYLLIICRDNQLRTSIDLMKENGFSSAKAECGRYPARTITDDDIALLAPIPNPCCTWTRMQQAVLNKSKIQHPTKLHLYGELSPISKSIQIWWTRYARCCWRSKDEVISDILLWTPSHGRVRIAWQARTYLQQLCIYTGCSQEDIPIGMDDRDEKWESVRKTHASGMQ